MNVQGAVALVTGGSSGLGAQIARKLAANGVRVAVHYHTQQDEANAVMRELTELGADAAAFGGDLGDAAQIDPLIEAVLSRFGTLNILVNNAAFNRYVPPQDIAALTPELWEQNMRVNLTAPFLLIRAAAPAMKASGSGRVVNIASTAAFSATGAPIAYGVSKAGLVALTQYMAGALGPEITVNCVAPGSIPGTRLAKNMTPEDIARMTQGLALKRLLDMDDIAEQVLTFIRSDSTTGQSMVIDAGRVFH